MKKQEPKKLDLSSHSIQTLVAGLTYSENLALAYKNVTGHVSSLIKEGAVTEQECFLDLKKLSKGFFMADNLSFEIEKELDRKMKSTFDLSYGTKTLSTISKAIDEKAKERAEKINDDKDIVPKKDKPKMNLA